MAIVHKKSVPFDTVAQAVPVTGGGGGGGGAATIADGADVAEGSTTDVAVTTDANGTVSAKLRGLVVILLRAFQLGTPLRVDPTGSTAQPVSGTVGVSSLPANASTNVAQLAGTTTSVNSGTKDAGTLRVVLATDQPQLTNKLLVTPDANSAVNIAQINGVTPLMGAGNTGTGSPRVTIASDQATLPTQLQPGTSGGCSVSSFLSIAAVQSTAIKASAGQVYTLQFFNNTGTICYVRLYNQTTAPASTDTANIVWRGLIPANTSGAGFVVEFTNGLAFSTGIGMRVTAAVADNDTTALAANAILGNVLYK